MVDPQPVPADPDDRPIDLPANSDPDPIAAPAAAVARPPLRRSHKRRGRPPGRVVKTARPTLPNRISFLVTDSGKIDLSRTTDENIRQLRGALDTPETLLRLGLVDASGEPATRTWATLTAALIDSINALAVRGIAQSWKLTDDQAALFFLRRKPETHEQVSALTGDLLDKYFPGGFGAYDKELTLLVLVSGFTLDAMQQLNAMRATTPATVHPWPAAAPSSTDAM